ncbi:MAG: helix-turn-helix transcriptional regulator [Lachnospiraceae bacterium]|nr:helix-turn-helix transcriptional regulator [Lachnospiraceae bacterium]
MLHDKSKFDILKKIKLERMSRNWSEYTLAKNSGIAQSTISSWYRKNMQPSVASIEKICIGFGISLSDFFESSKPCSREHLTEEESLLYEHWSHLSPRQRQAFLYLLSTMDTRCLEE